MKGEANFRFIESVNDRMAYAIVMLDAETTPALHNGTGELLLVFNRPDEYNDTVLRGAEYFFKYYHQTNSVDMFVNVWKVGSMLGDTSEDFVMYATIMALSEALNVEVEGFYLNKKTGVLHYPASPKRS
jgi:hypothetical protein